MYTHSKIYQKYGYNYVHEISIDKWIDVQNIVVSFCEIEIAARYISFFQGSLFGRPTPSELLGPSAADKVCMYTFMCIKYVQTHPQMYVYAYVYK